MKKEKVFFQNPIINSTAPWATRRETAMRIAIEIGQKEKLPNGLSPGQAAMVAIREAGCGGFDETTRKSLREAAREVNSLR